jgi:putative ABC transport system permease protein
LVLSLRLARRDLRRWAAETVLVFLALAVTAGSLTIGLVLHGQTAKPYALTRSQTAGPDVVAALFPPPNGSLTSVQSAHLASIAQSREVVVSSPVFPTTWVAIGAHGIRGVAEVQGRVVGPSRIDRPQVTSGRWLRGDDDGVVVERAFALAMQLRVGNRVQLGRSRVPVVGIAVSAALPPYPQLCTVGCILDRSDWFTAQPGLVWAPRRVAEGLATDTEPLVDFQYFKLGNPQQARAFVAEHNGEPPADLLDLTAWQDVAGRQAEQLMAERAVVVFGSTLLVVLALAALVVLVGGRMADEIRRVGALKAVGASPGFVTRLLLGSYLVVGLAAGAVGLIAGTVAAPILVNRSAGLIGQAGGIRVSPSDVAVVLSVLAAIGIAASAIPAWRAARMPTTRALADPGRSVRRSRVLTPLSRRLPTPVLLGLRVASRRPRRALLTSVSVAVAVCGIVVVLYVHTNLRTEQGNSGGPLDPVTAQLDTVMAAVTLLLIAMASVNLLFVSRACVVDTRHLIAIARTLGATMTQAELALCIAQLLPTIGGLALGGAGGALLFDGLSDSHTATPAPYALAGLAMATVLVVTLLAAVPARIEARRPIIAALRQR